jgi:hypothetical protein
VSEDDEPREIRRAVDELATGSPAIDASPAEDTDQLRLPEPVAERIREAIDDVAYLQPAWTSPEHHVCHVGVREGTTIRETLAVAGPDGVVTVDGVEAAVDELREGAGPSEVAGRTMEGDA